MDDSRLIKLCDIASDVHARIQQEFEHINPIVGISKKMREIGIPADLITIDELKSGKRIILILDDQQPGIISYQFSYKEKDPDGAFETMQFDDLNTTKMYDWVKGYFTSAEN